MKLQSVALTHVGRRDSNQDAFLASAKLGVFAVADGMGGYAGGEIASQLAIEALAELVSRQRMDDDATWPHALDRSLDLGENMLCAATRLAHSRIAERRRGKLAQMGSTVAMLLAHQGRAIVGHVGDSRVYRLRDGALEQLTRDHSLYQEMLDNGFDLPALEDFAYRNVITRALGAQPKPDLSTHALRDGDLFLLCSDGLSGPVPDTRMIEILGSFLGWPRCDQSYEQTSEHDGEHAGEHAAEQALWRAGWALVHEALERGGSDNVTVVLVRCSGQP
jgi:serine/threonine protein phosphatase PrpC